MEIKTLNNLRKNNDIYELFININNENKQFTVFTFGCLDRHNMRMDLVCYDIYENTNDVDLLCKINGIYNMLSVQSGDIIFYIEEQDLDIIRSNNDALSTIIDNLSSINKGKHHKIDNNRQNDLSKRKITEKNKQFTQPNLLNSGNRNIDTDNNGSFVLKPNF